jgi:hypothetical protein
MPMNEVPLTNLRFVEKMGHFRIKEIRIFDSLLKHQEIFDFVHFMQYAATFSTLW